MLPRGVVKLVQANTFQGPIFFQETIRQVVMEHRAREEEAGHDIWPASPQPTAAMKTGKFEEEEAFCAKLDMGLVMVRRSSCLGRVASCKSRFCSAYQN